MSDSSCRDPQRRIKTGHTVGMHETKKLLQAEDQDSLAAKTEIVLAVSIALNCTVSYLERASLEREGVYQTSTTWTET